MKTLSRLKRERCKSPLGDLGVQQVGWWHYLMSILLFILPFISIYPQDSLSHYLEVAAMNNPALKMSYSEYAAALERVPQASSLPDPEIQFGYFIRPMEFTMGNQVADIRFMQMFPWFGTLKAAKDEASQMAIADFEKFMDAKNQLNYEVKKSYYEVYLTKEEMEIAQQNIELLKSVEQLALISFKTSEPASVKNADNGMVNLLRVQIEINLLENSINLLADELTTKKAEFNRYLNRPVDAEVFIPDTLDANFSPPLLPVLENNFENHPVIKMLRADSAANAASVVMARRMGYPMAGIGVDYGIMKRRDEMAPGEDMIMPMVSFTIPIYRKKYRASKREAGIRHDAAIYSIQNAKNELLVSYQQAFQELIDAERRIKLYTLQSELAGRSINLLTSSFSAAGNDYGEILRMQQQLLDFRFSFVKAVVDKHTALAQLAYLSGNQ